MSHSATPNIENMDAPAAETFVFPASFAQQRLWFLDQLEPGTSIYNMPMAVNLFGLLNMRALKEAFTEMVRRHEVLRTTFSFINGEPVQVISTPYGMPVPVVDLRALSTAEQEMEAKRIAIAEASAPFDLESGPLLRARVVRLTDGGNALLLTMHHIISDGWSQEIFSHEIKTLYEAYWRKQPSPLPELDIQYADYAVWQREWLQGEVLERQLSYWRKQLEGVSGLDLPTDRPRPFMQTYRGAQYTFEINGTISDGLKELSQREGVTLYMTLLAAFQLLLSRYSGQSDVPVGTAIAGRNRAETEKLIGFFVNTLVMRTDLSGDPSFLELLKRVREVCLGAYAHQDVPFEKLVEELQPERDLSRSPLFQVMFVLQNLPQETLKIPGGKESPFNLPTQVARYDLVLSMTQGVEKLTGSLLYNTDLFERERMERLAGHYEQLLKSLVEKPEERASRLRIVSEREREELLIEWNNTYREYPQDICLHQLFEAQVERTPDATALIFEDQELSYQQLNERANQLARYLQEMGVGVEVLVGLCMERSVEMVVGLLGIMKAGGAYVPMDPQYPAERLTFMLKDADIKLLLTQERLRADLVLDFPHIICLDGESKFIEQQSVDNPESAARADNLAYLIYTSGSTGRPKGVMVQHRNVSNFFTAMDPLLCHDVPQAGRVWLALTSISFDISVLELLWTLGRGFQVVLVGEMWQQSQTHAQDEQVVRAQVDEKQGRFSAAHVDDLRTLSAVHNHPAWETRPPQFSLFYFAHEGSIAQHTNRYRLLLEGARFADRHGFTAIWTPERHFHPFGDLYPNPSITAAALSTITTNLQLRAGSVVMPLHHAVRVAEEWAMVDNLSGGRVGISLASGWHAADFIFAPEHYGERKRVMMEQLAQVRRLWRGEEVRYKGGAGEEVKIKLYPKPVQEELPVWLTAAGNPETFEMAGREGCGVLTHLLGQSMAELKEKIGRYREGWKESGREGRGQVSVMVHTYVGRSEEEAWEEVREPFKRYLQGSVDLLRNYKESLGVRVKEGGIREADLEEMVERAERRYYEESGMMGSVERCERKVEELVGVDVDEVCSLIDFGVREDEVLEGLERLEEVKRRCVERWQKRSGGNGSIEEREVLEVARRDEEGIEIEAAGVVTHMQCTPSLSRMLLMDSRNEKLLAGLKQLIVGGETLSPTLAQSLKRLMTGKLRNMYGPTETTVWSATQLVEGEQATVPIGRALANTQLYILDERMEPSGVGISGEIHIGGAGVVRGYLGRAALTAERFVPNPFVSEEGARMYRTGDVGRYLPGGEIEFLGRVDQQVKLRGYRIELGEIEAALGQHEGVRECVVVVRDVGTDERELVAYVVGGSTTPGLAEMRAHLREKLPEYMVPNIYVLMERLPLTPNGKINRNALPEPDDARPGIEPEFAAPRNQLEEMLTLVWKQVLRVKSIGINDDFFELGGHSLLATQLISRVREAFNVEIPLRFLFESPTVGGLAESIKMAMSRGEEFKRQSLRPVSREQALPVSFNQERRLLRDRMLPFAPAPANESFRLRGPLDVAALERGLREMWRRHEALRLYFGEVDGQPVLKLMAREPFSLPVMDLRALAPERREAEVASRINAEIRRPFKLDEGPLMRVMLLRVGEEEHVLNLCLDHIIFDGWSFRIFNRELAALYRAFASGQPSPLPELAVQFTDFAYWQRQWLQGEVFETLLAYWRKQLGGAIPEFKLPTDSPRTDIMKGEADQREKFLPPSLYESLKEFSQQEGCTLFMLLLAAFKTLMRHYASEERVTVLTPTAGRTWVETEEMIGWFTNILVLHTDLSGNPTFRELITRIRQVTLEAYAHQDMPFALLVKSIQPERDYRSAVPPQVFFDLILKGDNPAVQQREDAAESFGPSRLKMEQVLSDARTTYLDLNFVITDGNGGLFVKALYKSALFAPSTIERMLADYWTLLECIVADPLQSLDAMRPVNAIAG
jgi:natural product biosynthesis luciferase-like monooxygenase protein